MTHIHRASLPHWKIANHAPLSFAARPLLAGILNCTPDSFSDGGQFVTTDQAIAHGKRMIEQGEVSLNGQVLNTPATVVASLDGIAPLAWMTHNLDQDGREALL